MPKPSVKCSANWSTHELMQAVSVDDQVFGIFFDHGVEAVFTMHREKGIILSANRHLEDLIGRSASTLVGSPASELFVEDERGSWIKRLCEREGLHEDVRLMRLDGYPVFVSLTVAHIHHQAVPLVACIARDTTERRNLERDLITKHTALHAAHTELGRTVEQLQQAQAELEQRNRELAALGSRFAQAAQRAAIGEFSAGVSHSMNNPMAALASALRQIERRVEQRGTPELKEELARFLQRASQAVGRMESIVDAVRRAHKSGSLPSQAQVVSVADELRTALTLFEQRLESTKLRVHIDGDTEAWVPPDALHHVLSNLIDNAMLALGGDGTLELYLHTGNQEWLYLDISDNGPGLPAHVRENLFEPFVSGRAEGTGLGLSLSFRLARQWGGNITHSDRLDEAGNVAGTQFRIHLPRTAPAPSTQEKQS